MYWAYTQLYSALLSQSEATKSKDRASILNAFNAHLTTPCLLNVSPSTQGPMHSFRDRTANDSIGLVNWLFQIHPNSCSGWQWGCFFFGKGDLSPYKSFKIFWVILLLDSLNWMCWHVFSAGFWGLFMTWRIRARYALEGQLTSRQCTYETFVANQLPTVINCECFHVAQSENTQAYPGAPTGLHWVSITNIKYL